MIHDVFMLEQFDYKSLSLGPVSHMYTLIA